MYEWKVKRLRTNARKMEDALNEFERDGFEI